MTRLMVDLPADLEAKLQARAVQGGFADPQEYVRALIVADAAQLPRTLAPEHLTIGTKSDLEKLLLEGLESGESAEITASEWDEKRQKLKDRYSNRGLPGILNPAGSLARGGMI
jgi:antitoxin ParD1/3/4